MPAIAVRCDGNPRDGWSCSVTLRDGGIDVSTHRVRVSTSDVQRLAPAASEPTSLVRESFAFLLERETPRMILPRFDLAEIGRYFPEYDADIRRRMDRAAPGPR